MTVAAKYAPQLCLAGAKARFDEVGLAPREHGKPGAQRVGGSPLGDADAGHGARPAAPRNRAQSSGAREAVESQDIGFAVRAADDRLRGAVSPRRRDGTCPEDVAGWPFVLKPFDAAEAITTAEAARFSGMSADTVRKWISIHNIGRLVGGHFRVSRVALAMLLDDNRMALDAYLAGDRTSPLVVHYFAHCRGAENAANAANAAKPENGRRR